MEVIIVGRGGGSAEDLAAFNDEGLARAVAASEIPVISAVGHETDFTIVDFVADLRAPTPSAAAELVIRSRVEVENQAEAVRERLVRAMERRLLEARHALMERAQHGAFARMMDLIRQRQQKLDDLTYRLERGERQCAGADATAMGDAGGGGAALRCCGACWRECAGVGGADGGVGGGDAESAAAVSSARWSGWGGRWRRFRRWRFWSAGMRWCLMGRGNW